MGDIGIDRGDIILELGELRKIGKLMEKENLKIEEKMDIGKEKGNVGGDGEGERKKGM